MNRRYKIRATIIFFLFATIFIIILVNLYFIQIKNNSFFVSLGEKQYSLIVTSYPPRGAILDRTGKQFLAMNKDSIAAFILPKTLAHKEQVLPFLRKHFPNAYERFKQSHHKDFMYIARRLTPEHITLIEQANIPDIQFLQEPGRYYPVPSAGHVTGITDIDNKGLFGLELLFNQRLAGKPMRRSLHKDARSGHFYFDKEIVEHGEQERTLITTLDSTLQFLAFEELKKTQEECQAQEVSALIMNPSNGHILAMVTLPTFNPNETRNLDVESTKNKIINEAYELGSVIKVFAALACFQEGVVSPDDLIDCEQVKTTYVDGRKINTVPSSVTGVVPFSQVIEKSNNIGIAKVVKNLGNTLYDHYMNLGFGKRTGIEFPSEHDGFVNPPDQWSKQSIFSLSYGYEISATLLQLARAFGIIANNGYRVEPTLIFTQNIVKSALPLYSQQAINDIKNILENTVLKGSAQRARIDGYRVMAKTGTANLLINGQYNTSRNIYTCAGIIEKGNYQRVIVAFVKEVPKTGVYASTIAVPLFDALAKKTLIHDHII